MKIIFKTALCLMAAVMLAGCERPPIETVQTGFRGTGMEQIYNPRTLAKQASLNAAPAAPEAADAEGPKAKDVYKNVQVLGDLSVGQFNRHMAAITQWVSPEAGCAYCHNVQNFADDDKYTKVVARRMIQMTQGQSRLQGSRGRYGRHVLHLPPWQQRPNTSLDSAQRSPLCQQLIG